MADLPKKMRGVLLTGHGDADKLDIRGDIPVPTPGPGDVLIQVAAAGDDFQRLGNDRFHDFLQGTRFPGVIMEFGLYV